MTDTPPADAEESGPFTSTEVKTIEIAGPIKITLTTTYNSSHVPPRTSQVETDGDHLMDALRPLAEIIITKLNDIQRAQGGAGPT